MEEDDNIFQRQTQVIPKIKTKYGKPPTRLQKKAPASLLLDNNGNNNILKEKMSPLTPIPLLSPLIISPPPSPQQGEEFRFPVITGDIDNGNQDKKTANCVPREWQHPATVAGGGGGYMEQSSLFTTFQSKCVLVNNAE
ncbi:hypothetical protein JCGZ_02942 [Jatropha curcas]|uniref:Uncharacterized protein n=1 Tax=Jatropha curcas TaxID=180498 RepID=A0A067L1E2_JATCU|nr:uncharacterized protein LOC105629925 [Jatropha curcas]KDP42212.1 hypothetical protein JCGZ_02942 [Jatropha curcas]